MAKDVSRKGKQSVPDYKWQEKIAATGTPVQVPDTVTVVGTGGFGAWVGLLAATAGVQKLVLINPGKVDRFQLARGPFKASQVGSPKAVALQELIREVRPDAQVITHVKSFDPAKDGKLLEGLVFNGVSDNQVGIELWGLCARMGLQCYSGVYNGLKAGVMDHRPESLTIIKDAPVWVGSAVMCAALALHSAFVKPVNFYGSIFDLDQTLSQLNQLGEGWGM